MNLRVDLYFQHFSIRMTFLCFFIFDSFCMMVFGCGYFQISRKIFMVSMYKLKAGLGSKRKTHTANLWSRWSPAAELERTAVFSIIFTKIEYDF